MGISDWGDNTMVGNDSVVGYNWGSCVRMDSWSSSVRMDSWRCGVSVNSRGSDNMSCRVSVDGWSGYNSWGSVCGVYDWFAVYLHNKNIQHKIYYLKTITYK